MITGRSLSIAALALMLTTSFASTALAEDEETNLPLQYSERPLTLTKGVLAPDAVLSFSKIKGIDDLFVVLNAGVAYGITDDLEVHATVLPLLLSPDSDYGNPTVGAIYRLMDGALELGAKLEILIPIQDGSDFALVIGVPIDIQPAKNFKIQTGADFIITFADETQTDVWLPLNAIFSANENLFFGLLTGFLLPDTDFDFWSLPLRFGAGYTIAGPGEGPLTDITFDFGFPLFATNIGEDTINTDVIEFRLGARGYFLD